MQINNIYNVGAGGYNAYVVKGGKCALIDGVGKDYSDELIKNIEKVSDKIDYIIFNHASPFQAGILERLIEINPDVIVIGTIAAIKNIKEFVFEKFNEQIAKDGETLDLGGITLEFRISPNVPWPDTMLTYAKESKALFSGEMFSSSNASVEEFYDSELRQFGGFVEKSIKIIKSLDVKTIYPAQGNKSDNAVLSLYEHQIEKNQRNEYIVLCYMSRYGYTYEMAQIIAETIEKSGMPVKMFDAENGSMEMQSALNRARAVIFGSPTINRNAPPQIWEAVCGLDAVSQRGIPCMTFGSYGWSGDAPVLIHTHLCAMNFRMFEKPFTSVFRMNSEEKLKLAAYSERFAEFVKNTENNTQNG